MNRLVEERNGRQLSTPEVVSMVGEGAGLLVSRALAASGAEGDPAAALPRFLEIYDALLPGQTRPYPGILEALDALGRRAVLAVLTNKPTPATLKLLESLGLAPHFGLVVGGDGPFRRKPDPEGLLHLLDVAGVAATDAVLVGDSAVDLLTARAAGVTACLARYGFGYAMLQACELRGDELAVDRPADLPRVLCRA